MYEKVRSDPQPRRDRPLILGLILCALIFAVVVGLTWWAGRYQVRYREFVGVLSESTVYAYDHNSLTITCGGERYPASRENIHQIYTRITDAGPGRIGTVPEVPAEVTLDYGDGSHMELWMVELVNSSTDRTHGLFIHYVDREGNAYSYDSDKLELLSLPIEKGDNP